MIPYKNPRLDRFRILINILVYDIRLIIVYYPLKFLEKSTIFDF